MKTATGLALIAVGAILTFAVRVSSPGFSPQAAGVVLILVGLAGLLIPRKSYGWLRKRLIIPPRGRARRPAVVEETRYPPYVKQNPGTGRSEVGLPEKPFTDPDPGQVRATAPRTNRQPGDPIAGEPIAGEVIADQPRDPAPGEEIVEEFRE